MLVLSTDNFESEVVRSDAPVFVLFTAQWCGFCHSMERNIGIIEHRLPNVKFACVDIDKEKAMAQKYSVQKVPTSIVFKEGRPVSKKTGLLSKADIFALLSKSQKEKTTI